MWKSSISKYTHIFYSFEFIYIFWCVFVIWKSWFLRILFLWHKNKWVTWKIGEKIQWQQCYTLYFQPPERNNTEAKIHHPQRLDLQWDKSSAVYRRSVSISTRKCMCRRTHTHTHSERKRKIPQTAKTEMESTTEIGT